MKEKLTLDQIKRVNDLANDGYDWTYDFTLSNGRIALKASWYGTVLSKEEYEYFLELKRSEDGKAH